MERFKIFLPLFCCLSTTVIVSQAHAASVEYLWDKTYHIPKLNQFIVTNNTTLLKEEPLPPKAQLFTLNNKIKSGAYEYRLRNGFIDPEGVTHARYDEYYKNLRVLWADTVVHRKKTQSINGTMVTGIEKDIGSIKPKLTEKQAFDIAKQDFIKNISPKSKDTARLMSSELVIYPYVQDTDGNDVAHLAYKIDYYTTGINNKLANPYYIIDANTGVVLKYFDNLKHVEAQVGRGPGGNTNPALTNGSYNYGSGAAPLLGNLLIETETPAGSCTWGNRGVGVVSLGNAPNNPSIFPVLINNEGSYPVVVIIGCNAGTSFSNPNDNGEAPANGGLSPDNDMLYYGTQTYNLFTHYSVRNPSAPFGTVNPAIRYYVHIDSTDAFAQSAGCGNVPDACYHQQAVFGNGQTQYYPQVGYDVVGHETAHIYIGRTSNLVYANQSGGMNEAFADITGAALGAFIGSAYTWFPPISSTPPLNNPLGISFWTQGALDNKTAPALRYLYNPPLDGNSISNARNYTAGMDVHYSSGVYNKAFYNLSVALGGAIINYPAVLRAYRFFVAANDIYWTSNMDFFQGSCGVILAAKNPAYGGSHAQSLAASNAFTAVGVHCMVNNLDNITVT